jgi:hypothetical protein
MLKLSKRHLSPLVAGSLTVVLAAGTAWAAPGGSTGPSSSDPPYMVRHFPGVTLTSVLTVGDSVGGYRMVGIPDGLGAYDNGDGTFTVLMNHELTNTSGVIRDHGAIGAFVSKWVIDKETLEVVSGDDLIKRVFVVQNGQYVQATVAIGRLCSADLPARTALYNPATGLGYDGHIFLDGEEITGGRAFGHVVDTGDSYVLADIGTAAFENVVANPATGDKTVVVGTSDGGDQSILVYTGAKKSSGNPVEMAGLTGGQSQKIFVPTLPTEDGAVAAPVGPQPFTLAATGTFWDRPEDAAWDPKSPNDLYFVTTASMTKHSRLWHVHFTDVSNPSLGGTVEMVLEGPADLTPGPKMMDNLTVNDHGQVLIQEDPGGNDYLAGIWQYDIASGDLRRITDHDPDRFLPGAPAFETNDEESSGIIPAPFLGRGKYLLDVQNHTKLTDPELVEKGQLLVLSAPPGQKVG